MEINVYQAKTHLSRLLQRVAEGEEITIARSGVPVARLVAVEKESNKRPLGFARDHVVVSEDFDAPLPDEILASFYGGKIPKPAKSQRKPRK
ncbi:MAG TPA: type II toxin-antitoxin system Phd/YefM family antitoxin [Terriglobales bacterium]|jgi:prevent-host-death family protein